MSEDLPEPVEPMNATVSPFLAVKLLPKHGFTRIRVGEETQEFDFALSACFASIFGVPSVIMVRCRALHGACAVRTRPLTFSTVNTMLISRAHDHLHGELEKHHVGEGW